MKYRYYPNGYSSSSSAVKINESNIAWESDIKYKFRNAYINLPANTTW